MLIHFCHSYDRGTEGQAVDSTTIQSIIELYHIWLLLPERQPGGEVGVFPRGLD